jgi:hypothetical protein
MKWAHKIAMAMYCIRQNPYATTDQDTMMEFITSHNVITCPFGHDYMHAETLSEGQYNIDRIWPSRLQDKGFMETINIGDIGVTPLKGQRRFILYLVASEAYRYLKSDMYEIHRNGKYEGLTYDSTVEGAITFTPYVRDIKVVRIVNLPSGVDMRKWFKINSFSVIQPSSEAYSYIYASM